MGRNLSPIVRRELANLDKDADSRKSAMEALKTYVKDLDSTAIPQFLAQVSETKEPGSSHGEYTISLFQLLARVHGPDITPHIDNIMATIIKTLSLRAASFALHQECSKVLPAIARHAIDPTTPEDKKRYIIHSLCKPLSACLLGSHESLSSGAALCLKALVDSDNWRFASDDMVNEVCQNVAGAMEESSKQTNTHMSLVMALAKRNSLIVEAYARLLIQSGLRILNTGIDEANSQKRLSAIQMVNFLMKCLDPRSIFSELGFIIKEMENCQSDQMAYVRGAAYEALQTARRVVSEKGSKFDKDTGLFTGSNCVRGGHNQRQTSLSNGDQSPFSASPESRTLDSFSEYDSLIESPISTRQVSRNLNYDRGSANRKQWRYNNGVDVSLKDGLFSELSRGNGASGTSSEHYRHENLTNSREDHTDEFAGFVQRTPNNRVLRSTIPSPQRLRSQINVDNVNIYTTPRRLVHSLQDSNFSEKQSRRLRGPSPSKYEWSSPSVNYGQSSFSHDVNYEVADDGNLPNGGDGGGQFQEGSESVSSTEDVPAEPNVQISHEAIPGNTAETRDASTKKAGEKISFKMIYGLTLSVFAILVSLLWIDTQGGGHYLVPT